MTCTRSASTLIRSVAGLDSRQAASGTSGAVQNWNAGVGWGIDMARCWDCGEEIEFRYVDGRAVPVHLSGGWCQGGDGGSSWAGSYLPSQVDPFEKTCRPSACPKCTQPVFFIRHNGGSVWVDSLGWPWPKHSCFENEPVPSWFGYFWKQSFSEGADDIILFGVIIKAEYVRADQQGPGRLILAVDGGSKGRVCLATNANNSPRYLLGCIAIADLSAERLFTSNHDVRPILPVDVGAEELGLSSEWVTLKRKGQPPGE